MFWEIKPPTNVTLRYSYVLGIQVWV